MQAFLTSLFLYYVCEKQKYYVLLFTTKREGIIYLNIVSYRFCKCLQIIWTHLIPAKYMKENEIMRMQQI